MTKDEAIAKYGEETVEEARGYYETDFDKVLFWEDCKREGEYSPSDEERADYLSRASLVIAHRNRAVTINSLLQL